VIGNIDSADRLEYTAIGCGEHRCSARGAKQGVPRQIPVSGEVVARMGAAVSTWWIRTGRRWRTAWSGVELHALHGPAGISSDKSIGALQAD